MAEEGSVPRERYAWLTQDPLILGAETTLVDALAAMGDAGVDHALVANASMSIFGFGHLRRIAADTHRLDPKWLVGALAEPPARWTEDDDLPELARRLRSAQAVVVRDAAGNEAVLTSQRVLEWLVEVAQPFLLIADIEESIRVVLDLRLAPAERPAVFAEMLMRSDGSVPGGLDELSMGDYEILIGAKRMWSRFRDVYRNQDIARSKLAAVRKVRNQLFHFRGEIDPEDAGQLAVHRWWFADARERAERPRLIVIASDKAEAG